MIERINIENFKSLRKVDLKLGRLNLFIGTNASGKSNFFDTLRVLKGIADGKSGAQVFDEIRGGIQNALFRSKEDPDPARYGEMSIRVSLAAPPPPALAYDLAFDTETAITREYLQANGKAVFEWSQTDKSHFRVNGRIFGFYPNALESSQLLLAYRTEQFPESAVKKQKDLIKSWKDRLNSVQFLTLDPQTLRQYGTTPQPRQIGEFGKDFASVIAAICADAKSKSAYLSWLKELTPAEVENVGTLPGVGHDRMFFIKEEGREFEARVLSDGTLRFAAIAAAFFQPDMPRIMAIEETENGIHASRLRLLVELLRNQAAAEQVQVVATTHSPLLLEWLKPEEYGTTFFCQCDEDSGASIIKPLTELPNFEKIVARQSISDLFAEGWMEAAS